MIASISAFFQSLEPLTTKLIGSLLILFIGIILGKIIGVLVKRFLIGLRADKTFRRALTFRMGLQRLLPAVLTWVIYLAAAFMALNHLGLTGAVLSIITALILVILFISLLLALKDSLPNLFAGLWLMYHREFSVGDIVIFRNIEGEVLEVHLFSTKLQATDDLIVIPNTLFRKESFIVKNKKKK